MAVKAPGMNFYVAMKDLGTMNWSNAKSSCQNYSFCGNLKGTLPTLGQLQTMYKNKSSLESLLTLNGGKEFSTDDYYWSSTIFNGEAHYIVSMSSGDTPWNYYDGTNYVRPVFAF